MPNMEHFIRIAFWICTLSVCVLAVPRRLMEMSTTESDFNFSTLLEKVKCENDSVFYTQKNVESECLTMALHCFLRELNGTVREECEDPVGELSDALVYLEDRVNNRLLAGYTLNDSADCACEKWPEVPFEDFLSGLQSLLQQENSENEAA